MVQIDDPHDMNRTIRNSLTDRDNNIWWMRPSHPSQFQYQSGMSMHDFSSPWCFLPEPLSQSWLETTEGGGWTWQATGLNQLFQLLQEQLSHLNTLSQNKITSWDLVLLVLRVSSSSKLSYKTYALQYPAVCMHRPRRAVTHTTECTAHLCSPEA